MHNFEIDYIEIFNYLQNYQEKPYSNPDTANVNSEDKKRLLDIKHKGETVVVELGKIAYRCNQLFGLENGVPISWLDGSGTKTRKNLCVEMKFAEYKNNPISLSIFVERDNGFPKFRVGLEIKNDGIDKKTMQKYHSHLDMPIYDNIVYVTGSNAWGNPEIITDTQDLLDKIEDGNFRKVQPCIYVEYDSELTNKQYDSELMKAVKRMIPFYEYVIGKRKNSSGKAWLLTWNPSNGGFDDYDDACIITQKGSKYFESWNCASKHPLINDEVFLLKTGENPKGILAHGYVIRESYEDTHYNADKAAQGMTTNYLGVEFDWVQNYENQGVLLQDELRNKYPQQHWSPQASGIEIKESILPKLKDDWKRIIDNNDGFWPSYEEYPIDLTKEDWKKFLDEVEYPDHKGCMKVLKCFLDIGGIASCKQLSEQYGGHPSAYVGSITNTSRRALQFFDIEACSDGDVKRFFPIAFYGCSGGTEYIYKMRQELKEALQEMNLDEFKIEYNQNEAKNDVLFDKNMILYGPSGTGKTYSTAIYAVSICNMINIEKVKSMDYTKVMARYKELVSEGRVAFTTFHQSYGYEEFIEGIKPIVNNDDNIGYTIEDGIFKRFCKKAIIPEGFDVDHNTKVWKVVLKSGDLVQNNTVKSECFKENKIMYDWKTQEEHKGTYTFNQIGHFKERMNIGDIVVSYAGESTNIDAVGIVTGDALYDEKKQSYRWSRGVDWIETNKIHNIKHLNADKYLDNDALQQLKRVNVSDLLKLVTPKTFIEVNKNYVFVIDEINRGNISKIFGELITLIEDTKRAGMPEEASATLPYSGEIFSVPSNVYILGTMNTADRSIALMDTALRRRFQFIEMMPDANVLRSISADKVEDLDVAAMLEKINERITYLYDREHTIGHAFFTKLASSPNIQTLHSIFENSVIPLLQEYFYEDYKKIQLVLGDNGKINPQTKFILDEDIKIKDIFKGSIDDDIDLPEKKYSINKVAFENIESYKQIYK